MKSPWKFLVELASRGKAAEDPESASDARAAKQLRSPPFVVKQSVVPIGPTNVFEVTSDAATNEASGDAEKTETGAVETKGSEPTPTLPIDTIPAENRAPFPSPPGRRKPRPAKKARDANDRIVVAGVAIEYGEGNSRVQPQMLFHDEVVALDEEVKQLRRRLAEKLLLQNAQLKKMLERY